MKPLWIGVVLLLLPAAGLCADVHYVDANATNPAAPYTSWATAANAIQDALDEASAGDTVRVADGAYAGGGRVVHGSLLNRVAVTQAVTVVSVNGREATSIVGRGPLGDAAVRCVFLAEGAVLAGFTLTDGCTRTEGDDGAEQSGGGVWCADGATVSNCTIAACSAYGWGGGARGGFLADCTLAGNYADTSGGGASESRLLRCTVSGNEAWHAGGGLYACHGEDCVIAGNRVSWYGGGTYHGTNRNCRITGNNADFQGGGACASTLYDCLVASNSASQGGGLEAGAAWQSMLTGNRADEVGGGAHGTALYNCAIVENRASVQGGGAYTCEPRNCTIVGNEALYGGGVYNSFAYNSIIYDNVGYAGEANYDGTSTLTNCCTTPARAGGSNMTNAPGLLGARNVHLAHDSPCIDAGGNGFARGATDIDGETRLHGAAVDIGADEFVAAGATGVLSVAIVMPYTNVVAGTPLCFSAALEGRALGFDWSFGDGAVAGARHDIAHAYSDTGTVAVVLRAWNNDGAVAATATVHVIASFTNYVSADGQAAPPYTSWADAANAVQDAIDAAAAGGTVVVAPGRYDGGTYEREGVRHRAGLYKPVTVVASSRNPADTILAGVGPLGPGAVRCAYVGKGAVLSGFTLTDGHTATTGDVYRCRSGGGVWCEEGGVVERCVIVENRAEGDGGGVHGGLVRNSVLLRNESFTFGGGAAAAELRNCTVADNRAFGGGGTAWGRIVNSIVYYNTAYYEADNYRHGSLSYSCATPRPNGLGNTAADPRLTGRANPHLTAGSPCIDAGTNAPATGAADIDGETRLEGGAVDIGCDEFVSDGLTNRLSVGIETPYTNAVTGTPMRFEAAIEGRALGFAWTFGDGAGATNRFAIEHAYDMPGVYSVVLEAWNHAVTGSATVRVSTVRGFTNFVWLAGGHEAPFTDWSSAATNIQDAIDAATPGGTVLVDPGTYSHGVYLKDGSRSRVGLWKPLLVQAVDNAFGATVIAGEGPAGPGAVRCAYLCDGAVLAGFTLSNGYTRADGRLEWARSGGGAWCEDGAAISDTVVLDCHAEAYGGGIAGGRAEWSTFYGNRAAQTGGGAYLSDLEDCLLMGNVAEEYGGGAYGCRLTRCEVTYNDANRGGGVCIGTTERSEIGDNLAYYEGGGAYGGAVRESTIRDNVCGDLGGGLCYSDARNCLVAKNWTRWFGGGAYACELENCTVVGNEAWSAGGVDWGVTRNTIVYHNTASGAGHNHAGDGVFTYSCTTPAVEGAGNRTNAPAFVDGAGEDWRLSALSPCIDAGINRDWMFEATDRDGKPRVLNGVADLGAYETAFYANVRALLQGPYDAHTRRMVTGPGFSGAVPLTAPYGDDRRTVEELPVGAVDWVLLELRDTNEAVVASQSVLVDGQGHLISVAGEEDILMEVAPGENLSVAVKQRQHLAIVSAEPLVFTNLLVSYDFTSGPDRFAGGSNACVELEPGVWGMPAGDCDGDGKVTRVDGAIASNQLGAAGYLVGDANLDGSVTESDRLLVDGNMERQSGAPHPEVRLYPRLAVRPPRRTLLAGETASLLAAGATNPVTWFPMEAPSGGFLTTAGTNEVLYRAGMTAGVVDVVQAWDGRNRFGRTYANIIAGQEVARAGKAIVIAGSRGNTDPLWPITDHLADLAFNTLRYRGFSKQNIHYLSPEPQQDADGDGQANDIDARTTLANAAFAFTNWAARPDTERLFVYLVDHGEIAAGNGLFRLNGDETLAAAELDAWLDAMQQAYSNDVVIVIDCCYADSLAGELDYDGPANRVVLAACGGDEPAYFVAGGLVSFSDAFFAGVMRGLDLRAAFDMAGGSMAAYQEAVLHDPRGHADGLRIGASFVAGKDVPQIGRVLGEQLLKGDTVATMWADDIVSAYDIDRVWCLILPPGYDPGPEDPVAELTALDLAYNSAAGRYEARYGGFSEEGEYDVLFYARDAWGSVSPPRHTQVLQAGYDERVVLVAGGATGDVHWAAVDAVAGHAYHACQRRRIPGEAIAYLSAGPGQDLNGDGTNDVDAAATVAAFGQAVTNWARGADKLTVFMVGGETNGNFRLNEAESVSPDLLDWWLDTVQSSNAEVCVVMDFDGSGSFLHRLDPPGGAQRACVASSEPGRRSCLLDGGLVSFTRFLMAYIMEGQTVWEAYSVARRAIRRTSGRVRQVPMLDDDGDGDCDDLDGEVARDYYIGMAFMAGSEPPRIGTVMPDAVWEDTAPVCAWAADVTDLDGISNVWCSVTPPDYDGGAEIPVLPLSWNAAAGRYEADWSGLSALGRYVFTFQAEDNKGEVSAPVQSEILVVEPDAYEPDNLPSLGNGIAVGGSQRHTLHVSNDVDWVKFFALPGTAYEVEAEQLGTNVNLAIEVYYEQPDGTLSNIDFLTADFEGAGTGVVEWTAVDLPGDDLPSGMYHLRIASQDPALYGTDSDYEIRVFVVTGAGQLLVAAVDRLRPGHPPPDAVAIVDGVQSAAFGEDLTLVFHLSEGVHTVEVVVADGYIPVPDPRAPDQHNNPASVLYGNPKQKSVVNDQWQSAVFQFMPVVRAEGAVRDRWTGAWIEGATIAFTGTTGILGGVTFDGWPEDAAYEETWETDADGRFPSNVWLPAVEWDLGIACGGCSNGAWAGAVTSAAAGAVVDLGERWLTPRDTNHNAIGDAWENRYFDGAFDPADDPDNDGHDTGSEYLCGTDPTNRASVLRLLDGFRGAADGFELVWPVRPGRRYTVSAAEGMSSNAWRAVSGELAPTQGQAELRWTDTNAVDTLNRYYRLEVVPPVRRE